MIFFMFTSFISLQATQAQLKTTPVCPPIAVDILEGTVNETLFPYSNIFDIEKKLPCFSTATEESNGSGCGGVFFKDKDIYFFTERDYIELGENFKGTLSLPLIGANRNSLFGWLGSPKIKDATWDAFQTKYGILILYYNKAGKINKIQFSTKGVDTIKLCE